MDSDDPAYCPICGDHTTPSNSDSESIFQCFLKVFGSKWEGKMFSFCEECKRKLNLISELHRHMQALQIRLEVHEKQLQTKLKGSEVKFEKNGFYKREKCYFELRKQILEDKVSQPPSCSPENEDVSSHQQEQLLKVEVDSPSDNSLKSDYDEQIVDFNEAFDSASDSEDIKPVLTSHQRKRKRLVISSDSEEDDDDDDDSIPDEDKQDFEERTKADLYESHHHVYKKPVIYHNIRLDRVPGGFKCSECNAILSNSRHVVRSHVIKEHTFLHVCPHCSKRFDRASNLQRHLNGTHKKLPASECPICYRPLIRTESLRNHMWTHFSEQDKAEAVARGEELPLFLHKNFQCDQCSRSFAYLASLETHLKKKHGDSGKVKKEKELCGICGAAVVNVQAHTRFKHTKEEDKKFECGICKKRFAYNHHLQVHRKKAHGTDKPFQCDKCGRKFKFVTNLKDHRLVHEEVKPFNCHICGLGFSRNHVMARHISNVHEGKKRSDHKKSKKKLIVECDD